MNRIDWCASIDSYCERTDASFWSEPVNAFSNLAFILAALAALLMLRRRGGRDGPALWLIAVATAVGIGSFLFHTFANRWSLIADVLPIAVFIYSYFLLAMRRYLGLHLLTAIGLTFAFGAFSQLFTKAWAILFGKGGLDWTNGSVGYFPAALALFGTGALLLLLARGRTPALAAPGAALVLAGLVFCASLTFRTLDPAVCDRLPLGTHFLWHTLNGVVLFILMRAAIRFGPRGRDSLVPGA